jgi:hypothetical protein
VPFAMRRAAKIDGTFARHSESTVVIAISSIASITSSSTAIWNSQTTPAPRYSSSPAPMTIAEAFAARVW